MNLRLDDGSRFLDDPIGRYVVRRHFLVWCASETLTGTIFWGAPDVRDSAEAVALWPFDRHLRGYDCIMDLSRLRRLDPFAFQTVSRYAQLRLHDWASRVRRQVVLTPRDDAGAAMAAGLPVVLGYRHPWRVFADESAGLCWLERADAERTYAELRPLVDHYGAGGAVVGALRGYLASHPSPVSMAEAARALGRSPRSLQRHLLGAGTSFREELRGARMLTAADLLTFTREKLQTVAAQVGYRSMSHFSEAFVTVFGEPPSSFRERRTAC
jgi:AraC-like DNA-binding protein